MKKKYKRALAAALAAVMIWNTCDWHPQVLAGSSVQYIEEVKELSDEILHQEVPYGTKYKDLELPDKLKVRVLAEEASDEEDGAEDKDGAEKIATPSELQSGDGEVGTEKKSQTLSSSETDGTVWKASPSEADVTEKSEIGVDETEQKASPSDADGTKTDKNWKEVKVRWVLDETFSEKESYDGETPGIYVFDAELKSSRYELDTGFLPRIEVTVLPEEKGPAIIGFSELDEAIAVQNLPLGAKESDIVLPDTLEVEVEAADETLAEDSQNLHLVEAVNKGTETDTDPETAVWQISGITWKLDEEQSDLPEFHGGISEKDYFEEFDENGEPVETSTKTWAGYAEANQDYNGCAYVYTPVLPEEYPVGEEAELPEICVLVGEMQLMTLAGEEYDLNNEPLLINSANKNEFNGKTITGRYCPTNRPEATYTDIKGGIIIDNVTVDLTIKNVTIQSGGARGWNLAGIYLKGNAQLNLTLEGKNTLLGLDEGAYLMTTISGKGIRPLEENGQLSKEKEDSMLEGFTEDTVQILTDEEMEKLARYVKEKNLPVDIESLKEGDGVVILHDHQLNPKQEEEARESVGEPLYFSTMLSERDWRQWNQLSPKERDEQTKAGTMQRKQSATFCLSGYLDNRAEGFPDIRQTWHGSEGIIYFLISEKGFAKIPTEKKTLYMELNVENKKEAVVRKEIQNILEEENKRRRNVSATGVEDQSGEAGIFCISKSELLENAKDDIQGNRIIFGSISIVLLMAGMTNYLNIVVTGIFSRKKELEIMERVGMTKRQKRMLFMMEGGYYFCAVTVLLVTIGSVMLQWIKTYMEIKLSYFVFQYPLIWLVVGLCCLAGISFAVPAGLYMLEKSHCEQ